MEAGGNSKAQKVSIRPAKWSSASERWLLLSGQDATLADLYQQVKNGAKLFHVYAGRRLSGAFVLRVDRSADYVDGVLVAAAARVPGCDLTIGLLPHIEKMFNEVDRIRIHTARPGLAKKLELSGYEAAEIVLTKAVK